MPSKDQTIALCADPASSTSLLTAEIRVVVPCPHCRLIQFRTRNSMCRRCHKPLDETETILSGLIQLRELLELLQGKTDRRS